MPLSDNDPTPLQIIAAAVAIGGLAGMASALRTSIVLTGRYVGSSVLTSILTAVLTVLIGWYYVQESRHIYFLLGVSGLAGYGGATLLDAALAVLVKFIGKQDPKTQVLGRYKDPPSDEVKVS